MAASNIKLSLCIDDESFQYLIITNFFDGSTTNLHSTVLVNQNEGSIADLVPFQFLESSGGRDLSHFRIENRDFLVVCNAQEIKNGQFSGKFTVNSTIFEYDKINNRFQVFQTIETMSCLDVEFFEFGIEKFLVFVNHFDEDKPSGKDGKGQYDVDLLVFF